MQKQIFKLTVITLMIVLSANSYGQENKTDNTIYYKSILNSLKTYPPYHISSKKRKKK